MSYSYVGKIKSQFDLNHDLTHAVIQFDYEKISFDSMRLRFDLIWTNMWFDLAVHDLLCMMHPSCYVSIPATSLSVEQLFSIADAIISARRSSLSAATVESLLLCKET